MGGLGGQSPPNPPILLLQRRKPYLFSGELRGEVTLEDVVGVDDHTSTPGEGSFGVIPETIDVATIRRVDLVHGTVTEDDLGDTVKIFFRFS